MSHLVISIAQRRPPTVSDEDERRLRAWLRGFSTKHPRWGWRRAAACARKDGWRANRKHVQLVWRDEGLRVPCRRKRRPLRGIGVPVGAFCPIKPNVVWGLDFQFDQTDDARTLKLLNVVDEFTRECPAIVVERRLDADDAVACLDKMAGEGGVPAYVRFDHGPEFIAYAVADWCRFNGAGTIFIDPGCPWQNAWVESFNGRLRDELLNGCQCSSVLEGQSPRRGPAHRVQL